MLVTHQRLPARGVQGVVRPEHLYLYVPLTHNKEKENPAAHRHNINRRPILSRLFLLFLGLALVAVGGHARPMVGAAGAATQSSNPSPLLAAGSHLGALPLSYNDLGSRPRPSQSLTHGSHRSLLNDSESYAISMAIGSPMNSSCMLCDGLSQIVWELVSLLGAPWARPTPSPPPPQTQEYDPFRSFRLGSTPTPSTPASAPSGSEGEGDTLQQNAVNITAPLTPAINTTAANSSAANTSVQISAANTTVPHTTAVNATASNTTTTNDTSEYATAANITDGSTTAGNTTDLDGPLIQAMDGKTDVHTGVSNQNTTVFASNSIGGHSTVTRGSRNSSVDTTDDLKSSNSSLTGNSVGSLTIVLTVGPTTNATNTTTEVTKVGRHADRGEMCERCGAWMGRTREGEYEM